MNPSLEELRSVNPELAAQFEEQLAQTAAAIEDAARNSKVEAADRELNEAAQVLADAHARHAAAVAARDALNPEPEVAEEAPVEEAIEA